MVISKYRPIPRNIDSLGIAAKNNFLGKNQFFHSDLKISSFSTKYELQPKTILKAKIKYSKVISKERPFPRNIDSLGITAKNNFLGKNQFFHGHLLCPFP